MKTRISRLCACALISLSLFTSAARAVAQDYTFSLSASNPGTYIDSSMTWDKVTRYYEVYLPPNLTAHPAMVLMLHGTRYTSTFDPEAVISLNWGWNVVAAQYDFVLVKPASTWDPKTHQWNWNAYFMDNAFPAPPPDDSGFLRHLIVELTAQYDVNPKEVYVTGFSSGAQMTERVGNEISDLVAAIAPVAGPIVNDEGTVSPPLPLPTPPNPFPPISVQLWEGTKDQNLWPCGYGQTKYSGVIFTVDSADDTINYWTGPATNSCTTFQTSEPLCANGAPNNANDAPTPGVPGDTGNIATGCATSNIEVQYIWEPDVAHNSQPQTDVNRWLFVAAHPKPSAK